MEFNEGGVMQVTITSEELNYLARAAGQFDAEFESCPPALAEKLWAAGDEAGLSVDERAMSWPDRLPPNFKVSES